MYTLSDQVILHSQVLSAINSARIPTDIWEEAGISKYVNKISYLLQRIQTMVIIQSPDNKGTQCTPVAFEEIQKSANELETICLNNLNSQTNNNRDSFYDLLIKAVEGYWNTCKRVLPEELYRNEPTR